MSRGPVRNDSPSDMENEGDESSKFRPAFFQKKLSSCFTAPLIAPFRPLEGSDPNVTNSDFRKRLVKALAFVMIVFTALLIPPCTVFKYVYSPCRQLNDL